MTTERSFRSFGAVMALSYTNRVNGRGFHFGDTKGGAFICLKRHVDARHKGKRDENCPLCAKLVNKCLNPKKQTNSGGAR